MARLFIRHKPVEETVTHGLTENHFTVRRTTLGKYKISTFNNDLDFVYVCIVHNSLCWAARGFHVHGSGTLVRITCEPFNDDPSGQEMILADMILN